MKLLLDNGVPRSAIQALKKIDVEAVHVSEIGMAHASDSQIIDYAVVNQLIIVTLDADFHTLLALQSAKFPSVIRVRTEGLKGMELAELVGKVIRKFNDELVAGAAISTTRRLARCRLLPLI